MSNAGLAHLTGADDDHWLFCELVGKYFLGQFHRHAAD